MIVGQPTEVVKVRFQAQKRVAGAAVQNLKYTSTPAAYRQIGREEGIRGLWKGAMPNIGRNAIVNVSEIVCYDIVKECLMVYGKMRDNIYCHFTAAVIAGKVNSRSIEDLKIITFHTSIFNFLRIRCNNSCITS